MKDNDDLTSYWNDEAQSMDPNTLTMEELTDRIFSGICMLEGKSENESVELKFQREKKCWSAWCHSVKYHCFTLYAKGETMHEAAANLYQDLLKEVDLRVTRAENRVAEASKQVIEYESSLVKQREIRSRLLK